MTLRHVSSDPAIAFFSPRVPANPDAGVADPVVWAVDDAHLANYLVPRDCPRIAIRRGPRTAPADAARFFGDGSPRAVLFIEAPWFARASTEPLWLYTLPAATFTCADANAGYFVSRDGVAPSAVQRVDAPLAELVARGVELRVVPRLRPVAGVVAASSLAFSIIRLRNAAA